MFTSENDVMEPRKDLEGADELSPLKTKDDPNKLIDWMSWRWFGPGLLVCLADTDAGCLMVAGQSGARWGYSLLLEQILLIPILFFAQDLTVRLGIFTKKGHAACIKEHFGTFWCWFTTTLLVFECIIAVISEMSGLASVAQLWGIDRTMGTIFACAIIFFIAIFCQYRQVEAIAVTLGLFELTFVLSMFLLHPSPSEVFTGMFTFHSDSEYLMLVSTTLGAVIMPWMIYFQQSAVVARRLTTKNDLAEESAQTLFGSFLTQFIMIATMVAMAAAPRASGDLKSVVGMQQALAPVLGDTSSTIIISGAFLGGSLCATFVVALAASWAICEAAEWDDSFSLDRTPSEAPAFYTCFFAVVVLGAMVLLTGVNLFKLNMFIVLADGLLMPFAVGFLYMLACSDLLPYDVRVKGFYKYLLGALFGIAGTISLMTGFYGLFHEVT